MRVLLVAMFMVLAPPSAIADPPSQYRQVGQAQQSTAAQDDKAKLIESFHPSWIDWISAKLGVTGCGPYAVDRLAKGDDIAKAEYYEACDLEAQESVANSTRWLLILAGFQTLLGMFGAWLVWRTLRFNRDATDAALKSANLAERALFDGERPHVFVEEINVKVPVDRNWFDLPEDKIPTFEVRYSLMNYGRTPAIVTMANIGIYFGSDLTTGGIA
jgi:hypothetical protein